MGRPKGSKNRKPTKAARLNVVTTKPSQGVVYTAKACGCTMEKPSMLGSGGWCEHKNLMTRD